MTIITGIIQEITKTQRNAGEMADIVVAGQRYGAGLAKYLKAKEGDYVQFTAVQNGNFWNVERGSLKVSKNKPPAEAVEAAKGNVRGAVNSFDARQDAISRQAASNTAIAWLNLLQSAEAINVPATQAKSKGGAMAYYDTLRREYEKEFYEANTGNVWKSIAPNATEEEGAEEQEEETAPEDQPWE